MLDATGRLDERAIRDAYRRHAGELFGFFLHRVGDAESARDAVQETFLRAWRAADRYDPGLAAVRTWLFAIARNLVIDLHRRNAARPQLTFVDDPADAEPPPAGDLGDERMNVWVVEEALRRISAEQRVVIVEVYIKGRPTRDVADHLGVPAGTVRSRLFYGLKALRAVMDEMGVTL